jgi:hypothetical protein
MGGAQGSMHHVREISFFDGPSGLILPHDHIRNAKPQPPLSTTSSTEVTLANPEDNPVTSGKKRAREEDGSETGEHDGETSERPATRARTDSYKPNESRSLFGRLFAPVVKAFAQGFNESISKD